MVIESTFPIMTSSTDFEGCANSIPNAIAFLAFGAFCFVIGRTCLPPPLLGYDDQEAEIKHLKRKITTLESRLAQQDEGEVEGGRFHDRAEEDPRKRKRTLRTLQSQKELKAALEKVKALSAQKEYVQGECQKAMTELAVVKEELRGARTYMSMEDEYSGAEVVRHVERLNAVIMQAAANMAERLDVEMMMQDGLTVYNSNEETVRRAEDIIGAHLMKLLRVSRKQALLELAFQAAMALYTQKIVSSWCFRSLEDEELLQSSYMSMRQDSESSLPSLFARRHELFWTELQAIFGRWRQLTRTHLRASKSTIERRLVHNLAEELVDIIVAAGHRENPSSIRQIIMSSFPDVLGEIIDSAKELNRMIGEGVTSFDITVAFVKPNTLYDPAHMVLVDGSTPGNARERIVCTTDLGLVGIKKTPNSTDTSVMLRAKVILPSMLIGIEDI